MDVLGDWPESVADVFGAVDDGTSVECHDSVDTVAVDFVHGNDCGHLAD